LLNLSKKEGQTMAGQCYEPVSGAPPYLIITTKDIFDAVKNKWSQLGSPDSQCPSPQYGAPGSAKNNACRSLVAPTWKSFSDNFPDTPTIGPYNNIVDVVPMEEVCQMKVFGDPENQIGPPPNLFKNPGALGQQLQRWFIESQADVYCEPCSSTPEEGACFCWAYFVEVEIELYPASGGPSFRLNSRSAAWGPIYGVDTRVTYVEQDNRWDFGVFVIGQRNAGGIRNGTDLDCRFGQQEYGNAGGFGYNRVEIVGGPFITPFTRADAEFYFGYASTDGPAGADRCPKAPPSPPINTYPNTLPVYMPLPVPVLRFPASDSCPTADDVMNFNVTYVEQPGPPGPAGEPGPPGKDGESTMRMIRKVGAARTLEIVEPGQGSFGGETELPMDIAFVTLTWNSDGLSAQSNGPRVLFEPPYGQGDRREILCGNCYLRNKRTRATLAPFIHTSMKESLIMVPDTFGEEQWFLVVTDKLDLGYEVKSVGSFHLWQSWSNPDDIPKLEYEPINHN
jgi:hypothetical protein